MSWPHILSISRVVAAAPIGILVLAGHGNALFWGAVLFTLASITDLLDGPLARRGRKVSPFGIYLDTTGDKVLVSVVLIAMSSARMLDAWMVMIIVGREFLVTGVRTLAAVQGFVIPANFAGKVKTTITLLALILVLLVASAQSGGFLLNIGHLPIWHGLGWWAMVASVALTVVSGAKYIGDSRDLFLTENPPEARVPAAITATEFDQRRSV